MNTFILLDVSGSMETAIAITPEVVARVAPVADNLRLWVYNTLAREINLPKSENPLATTRQALRHLRAQGGTYVTAALDSVARAGEPVDALIIITDGVDDTNAQQSLLNIHERQGFLPKIAFVIIDTAYGRDVLTPRVSQAGIPFDLLQYTGDYNQLDAIPALLGGERRKTIAEQIYAMELPRLDR